MWLQVRGLGVGGVASPFSFSAQTGFLTLKVSEPSQWEMSSAFQIEADGLKKWGLKTIEETTRLHEALCMNSSVVNVVCECSAKINHHIKEMSFSFALHKQHQVPGF